MIATNQGFSQRSGHSSVLDPAGNIYVIAGLNGTSSKAPTNYMNDIWVLNITSSEYFLINYYLSVANNNLMNYFVTYLLFDIFFLIA